MRFVWAVVAFVLATVLIGAGIAQRTIFMGPSEQRMELAVDEPQPYVLVDAEVLGAHSGLQTLLVRGKGEIFVAYGRTDDVKAWLSDTSYTDVTLAKGDEPRSETVAAQQSPAGGGETSGRNPADSDLWLDSFADKDSLVTEMQLTPGHSILIARDGVEPAPDDILVSWGLDTRTPLAGPLMVAGGVLLLAGLVLYFLAIRHQRRGRGPLRKGPAPLPETQPIEMQAAPRRAAIDSGDDESGERGAQEPSGGGSPDSPDPAGGRTPRTALRRRLALGLPALTLTAVLATGCSAESWPEFGAETPTPTPTPTVVTPEDQKPPVVTEQQGQRIVSQIAQTVEKADSDRDITLAETRLAGAVLEARRTEYTLRGQIAERTQPLTAPRDKVKILLPEAADGWPRSVLALTVSEEDDTAPPVLLTMTQDDPWSNYRITEMADMPASSEFPDVAPAWLGTTKVPDDSPFLAVAPEQVAAAFADFVDNGDKSEYAGRFDETAEKLAQSVRDSRAAILAGLKEKQSDTTSAVAFDMKATDEEPLSLATLGSGAVVAVRVDDIETITPTTADAVIRIGENPEASALTGVKESAKGFTTTYAIQLFFSVPAQGSNEQIRLLAYHQDLLSVKVNQ
ncbi:glycosyl transferase [Microbacterium esteraromaticum]|uniref:Glycosyl transferase n=1 Tax=Microbacterium esteraromaticum TaxID=57043 RepID=A0A7D7WGN8_9MICO|nr:glycosyl transferase [Microbacterium esteraromaticum]QMU98092.1 glycosyl transferase [Microbacterium esteraromaticum]